MISHYLFFLFLVCTLSFVFNFISLHESMETSTNKSLRRDKLCIQEHQFKQDYIWDLLQNIINLAVYSKRLQYCIHIGGQKYRK